MASYIISTVCKLVKECFPEFGYAIKGANLSIKRGSYMSYSISFFNSQAFVKEVRPSLVESFNENLYKDILEYERLGKMIITLLEDDGYRVIKMVKNFSL